MLAMRGNATYDGRGQAVLTQINTNDLALHLLFRGVPSPGSGARESESRGASKRSSARELEQVQVSVDVIVGSAAVQGAKPTARTKRDESIVMGL
jgi:hypothetical protein